LLCMTSHYMRHWPASAPCLFSRCGAPHAVHATIRCVGFNEIVTSGPCSSLLFAIISVPLDYRPIRWRRWLANGPSRWTRVFHCCL